jgi:hypothetical protein
MGELHPVGTQQDQPSAFGIIQRLNAAAGQPGRCRRHSLYEAPPARGRDQQRRPGRKIQPVQPDRGPLPDSRPRLQRGNAGTAFITCGHDRP